MHQCRFQAVGNFIPGKMNLIQLNITPWGFTLMFSSHSFCLSVFFHFTGLYTHSVGGNIYIFLMYSCRVTNWHEFFTEIWVMLWKAWTHQWIFTRIHHRCTLYYSFSKFFLYFRLQQQQQSIYSLTVLAPSHNNAQ